MQNLNVSIFAFENFSCKHVCRGINVPFRVSFSFKMWWTYFNDKAAAAKVLKYYCKYKKGWTLCHLKKKSPGRHFYSFPSFPTNIFSNSWQQAVHTTTPLQTYQRSEYVLLMSSIFIHRCWSSYNKRNDRTWSVNLRTM